MPFNIKVTRDGSLVDLPWGEPMNGYFALSCCMTAAVQEARPEIPINDNVTFGELEEPQWVDWSLLPIYALGGFPLLDKCRQTLERDHTYEYSKETVFGYDGGERVRVELKAGDVITAWRD